MGEQARQRPTMRFMTLAHLIDVALLWDAYHRPRKDGAPGLDGVTAAEHAANLAANLADWHARLGKCGLAVAPDKTRVIPFSGQHARGRTSFDCLGFEFR
jgi:RNA-directed DNA polymerase